MTYIVVYLKTLVRNILNETLGCAQHCYVCVANKQLWGAQASITLINDVCNSVLVDTAKTVLNETVSCLADKNIL